MQPVEQPAPQLLIFRVYDARPKLAWPAYAMKVFLTAQLPCPVRVFGYPHELLLAGLIAEAIEPDVSNATMKYGFAGAGHFEGSGSKHAGASAARTGRGASEPTTTATPATSARTERRSVNLLGAGSFITGSSGRGMRR